MSLWRTYRFKAGVLKISVEKSNPKLQQIAATVCIVTKWKRESRTRDNLLDTPASSS